MKHPIRTGTAFALTVGIGYVGCTFIFWLWPEASASFMNGLFHGLDFRKLQSGSTLFDFGAFFYTLAGLLVWAFGLGAFFGWVSGRLGNVG